MRAGSPLLLAVLPVLAFAQPNISGIVNAASYSEALSPGCWMAIFGDHLAANTVSAASVPLPLSLAGTSVTVDGHPAALLFVSATQVNALVPFEVGLAAWGPRKVQVVLSAAGGSATFPVYISRNSPALFTMNSAGTGRVLAFNSRYQPADLWAEHDVVMLYATGLGATNPPGSSSMGAATASSVVDPVEAFVGDQQAEVLYAGLAPGFPGIYQVNVRVPTTWTDRLFLRQRGWLSNIVQIGVNGGSNAEIISASIDPVLPTPGFPVSWSLPFLGAAFQVELTVKPGAKPFAVAAVAGSGGAFTRIDPANGIAESFLTGPSAASAHGDFATLASSMTVMDFFAGCTPFPGNVIPATRLDPGYLNFVTWEVGSPEIVFPGYASGTWAWTRGLDPGGHFYFNDNFGDFLQIPCGSQNKGTITWSLYVDGKAVVTKDVAYSIAGR